ncbi:hypothetical protein KR044_005977 [Drosophila immigrans]|nr:hypothetical protein KR044_005977 [Drosophila immigrans]
MSLRWFCSVPLALFICCVLVHARKVNEQDMGRVTKQCEIENDAELKELHKILGPNGTDLNSVEMKYKCLIHCSAKGLDFLDSNDHMDMDKYDEVAEWAPFRNEVVECKTLNDNEQDKCEYAFKFTICLKEKYNK